MTRSFRIEPEAEAELLAAAQHYESKRPGLGVELVAVIDSAIDEILEAPEANPVWHRGYPYRRRIVRRFPYAVFYTVDGDVNVVAFAHAKREPGYWLSR